MVVCLQKCHQQLLPSLWHMPLFHQVMESVCPLLQLGWLRDLLWTTECSGNYAAILGPRPLEAWQVLLSFFRDLASMLSQAGLLNEERPHGQRKAQPGCSCSSHPGEAWDTWVKPSWTSELLAEWATPADTLWSSRTA